MTCERLEKEPHLIFTPTSTALFFNGAVLCPFCRDSACGEAAASAAIRDPYMETAHLLSVRAAEYLRERPGEMLPWAINPQWALWGLQLEKDPPATAAFINAKGPWAGLWYLRAHFGLYGAPPRYASFSTEDAGGCEMELRRREGFERFGWWKLHFVLVGEAVHFFTSWATPYPRHTSTHHLPPTLIAQKLSPVAPYTVVLHRKDPTGLPLQKIGELLFGGVGARGVEGHFTPESANW